MNLDQKITQDQAAELLGCTQAHVSVLIKRNWVKRPLTVGSAIRGYVASLQRSHQKADTDLKQAKLEEMKTRTDRLTAKFKHQAEAQALAISIELWSSLATFLSALPAMVSGDLERRRKVQRTIDAFKATFTASLQ